MRLIDGDALKRKAQDVATEAWKMRINAKVETVLNQFIDWIDDAPTIKPKKGKWIRHSIGHMNTPWGYDCSACGAWFVINDDASKRYDFCPNCGSDNRGEQNE